jgi:hypothetical protein
VRRGARGRERARQQGPRASQERAYPVAEVLPIPKNFLGGWKSRPLVKIPDILGKSLMGNSGREREGEGVEGGGGKGRVEGGRLAHETKNIDWVGLKGSMKRVRPGRS